MGNGEGGEMRDPDPHTPLPPGSPRGVGGFEILFFNFGDSFGFGGSQAPDPGESAQGRDAAVRAGHPEAPPPAVILGIQGSAAHSPAGGGGKAHRRWPGARGIVRPNPNESPGVCEMRQLFREGLGAPSGNSGRISQTLTLHEH